MVTIVGLVSPEPMMTSILVWAASPTSCLLEACRLGRTGCTDTAGPYPTYPHRRYAVAAAFLATTMNRRPLTGSGHISGRSHAARNAGRNACRLYCGIAQPRTFR